MKPSHITLALKSAHRANVVPFVWGPPGIGKSAVINQYAASVEHRLIDLRLSQLEPYDIRGLPSIADGKTVWNAPNFLPGPDDEPTIIFVDELNQADKQMQAAAYQLILDREVGDFKLADQHWMCAAGNRQTDRAIVNKMGSALVSRMIHLDYEMDHNDWNDWALDNDIHPIVLAFYRFRPELLYTFDPQSTEREYSCPRTAEFVSDLLKTDPDKEIEFDLIKGTVGEGVAAELHGFAQIYRNLPDPDVVLMNPQKADVPDDPATLFALCGALSRRANEENAERVVQYADRLPDEFSVVLMRDATHFDKGVQHTKAFAQWIRKHADVLGHK